VLKKMFDGLNLEKITEGYKHAFQDIQIYFGNY